jgi:ankyrin repeat protein
MRARLPAVVLLFGTMLCMLSSESAAQGDRNPLLDQIPTPPAPRALRTGETELMDAVERDDIERVKALLAAGVSPNEQGTSPQRALQGSPLPLAVCRGNYEMVKLLLERGASIESTYRYNRWGERVNAIEIAATNGHRDILELLLAHNPKSYGIALEWACNDRIATMLCEYFNWPRKSGMLEGKCAKVKPGAWDACYTHGGSDPNKMCR